MWHLCKWQSSLPVIQSSYNMEYIFIAVYGKVSIYTFYTLTFGVLFSSLSPCKSKNTLYKLMEDKEEKEPVSSWYCSGTDGQQHRISDKSYNRKQLVFHQKFNLLLSFAFIHTPKFRHNIAIKSRT